LWCGDRPANIRRVWPKLQAVEQLALFGQEVVVRADGAAWAGDIGSNGPSQGWPGASWARPSPQGGWLFASDRGVSWLGVHGEESTRELPEGKSSAPPVFDQGGTAYVPLQSGDLLVIRSDAGASCVVRIWDAPLAGVLWFGRELLVWNRQGKVAAVSPSSLIAACQ
jgi:hypothetical protein